MDRLQVLSKSEFRLFSVLTFYAQISWNLAKFGEKNLSTCTVAAKDQLNYTIVSPK